MLLDRLESGFLLLETQQGLVRVELSLRQRIYLLWTFRNFRQLSIPLLNPRQRALINALFRKNAGVVSYSHNNPLLVIGLVEKFVPPKEQTDTSPAQQPVQEPTQKKEDQQEKQEKKEVAQPAEIGPKPNPVPFSSPRVASSRFAWSKVAWSRFTWSRLATTGSVMSLCIVSVVAWHRIQGIPGSQAHNQPRPQQVQAIALPDSPDSAKPAVVPESPIAESITAGNNTAIAPSAAIAPPLAAAEAAVKPASIAAVISTPVIPAPVVATQKRALRVHDVASTPNLPLSGQDSGIQASRPPLRFAYPEYPDIRARGVVALTAQVDSDGAVRTVRVVSGNRALAAAAVRAVRQWRYRPYLKDGQPVATETNIVIAFISDDAISMTFPPRIPPTH